MHKPLPHRPNIIADSVSAPRHILHRDDKSRSRIDLRKVGAHKYATDPSTEVTCCAYELTTTRCSFGFLAIQCRWNLLRPRAIRNGLSSRMAITLRPRSSDTSWRRGSAGH